MTVCGIVVTYDEQPETVRAAIDSLRAQTRPPDEIPNVLNVLRGEMSLVGPRPLPVRDHALLAHWHRRRSNVLPGMTGLWQIAGRSNLPFDDLVRLDFYYLENWSIWLDITILFKTPFAVFSRKGAY